MKVPKKPHKVSAILFKKLIENVVTSNKTVHTEIPFVKRAKQQKVIITLIPFGENSAKIETIIVLVKKIEDITETGSPAPDEEIKELNKYQQIVSHVLDGVIGFNKEGKINFWNESSTNLFGLTRSEVYGKYIGKIFTQIDENYFKNMLDNMQKEKFWEDQLRVGEDEGIAEYYSVKAGIIGEDEEESVVMLCSSITQRIKIEKELRKSEERFRNIVTNSQEFICTLELSGKITYAILVWTKASERQFF